MTSRTLDQLAQLARKADAPALDDTAARRLVDAAIARAHLEPTVAPRRHALRWAAAGALAVAAAIALFVLRAKPAPATMHLALPTGDILTGTAGAHFAIAELTPGSRKLRLDSGAIVCDVAHIVAGQHFEVTAGDVTVVATGTVFSVSAAGHVHVYEGTVDVHRGAQVERLAAGASSGRGEDPRELVDAGEAAARARREHVGAASPPAHVVMVPGSTRVVMVPVPVPMPVPVEVRTPAAAIAVASAPLAAIAVTPAPPAAESRTAAPPAPPAAIAVTPAPPAAVAVTPAPLAAIAIRPAPPASESRSAAPQTPPAAEPASASPPARPPPPQADDALAAAREDVAAGRYPQALDKVAAAPHPLTGAWLLVDADALRALGKKREAADALAQAAAVLDGTAQTEAAYSAAYLRWHELHDAAGALAVLTGADVDVTGSLFEERGLVLHVAILTATNRRDEARPLAQRYLDHFPRGEQRPRMLAIARQDASK